MIKLGRKRGARYPDRPDNVLLNVVGGITYFIYRFPDGRRTSLGSDSTSAFTRATALNGHFAAQLIGLEGLLNPQPRKATPRNPLFSDLIHRYSAARLPEKGYSARSLEGINIKLRQYERYWAQRTVSSIDTRDISAFMEECTISAYIKHRSLLLDLFQFAGHLGFIKANPVAVTLKRSEPTKIRQRHTVEGYNQVRSAAPIWLRMAMDLALYSLQRAGDLVTLHRSHVDADAGTLTIIQSKTKSYNHPVHLEIVMTGELQNAVDACLRSDIPCPYLVHARPTRMSQKARQAKPHPFAVTRSHLSKTFTAVRDQCGAYSELPKAARPTFHELRALGIHLYKEAGFTDDYVMALSGHATKAMLDRYERDHAQAAPRRVEAGLRSVGRS